MENNEFKDEMPVFTIMINHHGQKGWRGPQIPWETELEVVAKSDFLLLQQKLKQRENVALEFIGAYEKHKKQHELLARVLKESPGNYEDSPEEWCDLMTEISEALK